MFKYQFLILFVVWRQFNSAAVASTFEADSVSVCTLIECRANNFSPKNKSRAQYTQSNSMLYLVRIKCSTNKQYGIHVIHSLAHKILLHIL